MLSSSPRSWLWKHPVSLLISDPSMFVSVLPQGLFSRDGTPKSATVGKKTAKQSKDKSKDRSLGIHRRWTTYNRGCHCLSHNEKIQECSLSRFIQGEKAQSRTSVGCFNFPSQSLLGAVITWLYDVISICCNLFFYLEVARTLCLVLDCLHWEPPLTA